MNWVHCNNLESLNSFKTRQKNPSGERSKHKSFMIG